MKEVVFPRLKEFARLHGYDTVVIVLYNASYRSRLMPQFRRPKRVKKEIQQWLTDHRIEFGAREMVAELWQKVTDFLKNHVGDRYYMDDYLKTEEGIETVRLPPDHCDFNPIENAGPAAKARRLPQALRPLHQLEDDYWDIDTKEDRIEAVGDEQADEDIAEEGGDLEPLDQDLDDDNDLALLPFWHTGDGIYDLGTSNRIPIHRPHDKGLAICAIHYLDVALITQRLGFLNA
ncbi:hypothetical protein RvY_17565 [Ramazzottius varieornatus]|uniref:Uncharacterized protein n=1 Tax=Ramazzottius varieornatus TaxID=947166 RepID=A0A1D1W2J2_RAMVA|nr:hypothetical protein RvY_17565 [Ramazzottius varieornatus]